MIDIATSIGLMSLGVGTFSLVFLLLRSGISRSNVAIGVLLTILLTNLIYSLIIYSGKIASFPTLYTLLNKGYAIHLLIYPVLLLYVQTYTRSHVQIMWIGILFLPPILLLVRSVYQFNEMSPTDLIERVELFLLNTRPGPPEIYGSPFLIITNVIIPSMLLIKLAHELGAYFNKGVFRRTRHLLIAVGLLFVLIFAFRILGQPVQQKMYRNTLAVFVEWEVEILFMSLFLVVVSFLVMLQSGLENLGKISLNGQTYSISKLNGAQMTQIVLSTKQLVETDHYYSLSKLTISDVARELGINSKYLSQSINQVLGKKFPDYLNELRVAQAKKLLLSEQFDKMSIEGIAAEVGFSSRATFYRAFKQLVGTSPIEFRNQHVS